MRGGDSGNQWWGDGKWRCSLSLSLFLFYEMSNGKMKRMMNFIRECPTEFRRIFPSEYSKKFEFSLHQLGAVKF